MNNRNTYQTSQVLLDRVINVLDRNTQSEEELINSLKDDYIVRAKAVAYIIDAKPEAERKIANLMSVDEVHLFDKDGTIYSGSVPKYYGYNFDSGEQIEYFKPMLTDKTLTCAPISIVLKVRLFNRAASDAFNKYALISFACFT